MYKQFPVCPLNVVCRCVTL